MSSHDDQWTRADRLFDAALELSGDEREAYLRRECGDDAELLRLVGRLLAEAETRDDFLAAGEGVC